MPLVSVPAIYDGQQIRLLEKTPVESPYGVVVTFLGPTTEETARRHVIKHGSGPRSEPGRTAGRWMSPCRTLTPNQVDY